MGRPLCDFEYCFRNGFEWMVTAGLIVVKARRRVDGRPMDTVRVSLLRSAGSFSIAHTLDNDTLWECRCRSADNAPF